MAIIKIIENVASITEVHEEVVKAYIRDWDTGAGAVLLSEILAKGDLIVGTGAGTVSRLPKGDDGDEIVYDSTETLGIKTQAKTGGNLSLLASGRLSDVSGSPVPTANAATDIDEIYLVHYNGDRMPLLSGATWTYNTFTNNISIKTTDAPTGDTVNGSAVVTAVSDASQLVAGMEITGTGIPGSTLIQSVDSDSQITLDANATADGTGVTLTCKIPALSVVPVCAELVSGSVVLRFGTLCTTVAGVAALLTESAGVKVISGDTGKRYLGYIVIGATAGQIPGRVPIVNESDRPVDPIEPRPNVLINGNMDIWQRGTSFAAIANAAYSADRYRYLKGGAMVHTISQSTDVPTEVESGIKSNYSLKIDCTTIDAAIAAGDYCWLYAAIEGFDYSPLKDNTVTLSFWVKGTKTGTYCVAFRNNGTDRSYVVEYTINTTATWEKKTVTITLDQAGGTENYTNNAGLYISFALAIGTTRQTTPNAWQNGDYVATANQVNACDSTDNDFYLAQVKLELGSGATPFVTRPFEQELALCQRYYWKSFDYAVAPAQGTATGSYISYRTVNAGAVLASIARVSFPVKMRTTPTVVFYNTQNANAKWYNPNRGADSGDAVADGLSESGIAIYNTQVAADATTQPCIIHATASAEL